VGAFRAEGFGAEEEHIGVEGFGAGGEVVGEAVGKEAEGDFGGVFSDFEEPLGAEGDDEAVIEEVVALEVLEEQSAGNGGFEFEDGEGVGADGKEGFVEGGDACAGEAGVEPTAGIEAEEVEELVVFDASAAVGGALEGFIVNDDDCVIGGELDIELDGLGVEANGFIECGDGVLGRVGRGSTMCDRDHFAITHTGSICGKSPSAKKQGVGEAWAA